MVETLSNLLRSVVALSPSDLLPILYLSLSQLGPPQQGLELGVGDGVLLKAVAQATGEGLGRQCRRSGARRRWGGGGDPRHRSGTPKRARPASGEGLAGRTAGEVAVALCGHQACIAARKPAGMEGRAWGRA